MALREIVLMGDPVLRQTADEVVDFDDELQALVRDMFETMYHAEGIGLAAPQIGLSKRIIVVDLRAQEGEEPRKVAVINPVVVWQSDETEKESEGCLSIPGLEELVNRPASVRVEGKDPEGKDLVVEADGLFARALQHEIDHVNGILFLDRVSPLKRKMLLKKWKKLQAEEA
ncbi:MAG: peptide deformylase [Longimicrobiales bacterium]|nr:peptide deformylase [Longimicrobiales bacterium]